MAQETMESLGAKRGRRQTEAKKKEDIPLRHPVDVANGKRRGEPIVRRAEEAAQRREGTENGLPKLPGRRQENDQAAQRREGTENGLPKIPGRRQENDQAAQRREGANRRENQLQQLSGNNLSYYYYCLLF